MLTLIFKEIKYFFITSIGYIVLGVFWTFNTFLFIIIENDYNLFQNNFISFSQFFKITPWMLIILIPVIVMRSFNEEIQSGTIDLIISKPISIINILWSKFFGCLFLFTICILPTIIYIIYIFQFSLPYTAIDYQVIIGSYIGLLFLGSNFISICLPISILFKNQISVFISGSFFCYLHFFLFNELASLSNSDFLYKIILNIGSQQHYNQFISGVLYIKDIGYFIGFDIIMMGISLFLINKSRSQ